MHISADEIFPTIQFSLYYVLRLGFCPSSCVRLSFHGLHILPSINFFMQMTYLLIGKIRTNSP